MIRTCVTVETLFVVMSIFGFILAGITIYAFRTPKNKCQPADNNPALGTVEIIEFDGKYAVRQFGYFAGYGKAPAMSKCTAKEVYKKPTWDFVDHVGKSTGVFYPHNTPKDALGNLLYNTESFAICVANRAHKNAKEQLDKIRRDKERNEKIDREYQENLKKVQNAEVIQRIEV